MGKGKKSISGYAGPTEPSSHIWNVYVNFINLYFRGIFPKTCLFKVNLHTFASLDISGVIASHSAHKFRFRIFLYWFTLCTVLYCTISSVEHILYCTVQSVVQSILCTVLYNQYQTNCTASTTALYILYCPTQLVLYCILCTLCTVLYTLKFTNRLT